MNNRKCLVCFEQLKGRIDQKFCSNQCRSSYNNRQVSEMNLVIKATNKILKKNHLILAELNAHGKTTVNKIQMEKQGFRFDFFTNICPTPRGQFNYFCYEHGFREQAKNKVILIHRDASI